MVHGNHKVAKKFVVCQDLTACCAFTWTSTQWLVGNGGVQKKGYNKSKLFVEITAACMDKSNTEQLTWCTSLNSFRENWSSRLWLHLPMLVWQFSETGSVMAWVWSIHWCGERNSLWWLPSFWENWVPWEDPVATGWWRTSSVDGAECWTRTTQGSTLCVISALHLRANLWRCSPYLSQPLGRLLDISNHSDVSPWWRISLWVADTWT